MPPVGTADDAVASSPAVTGTSMPAATAGRPLPTDAETGPLLADRDALDRAAGAAESPASADPVTPEPADVDAALRGVARGPAFRLALDPLEDELDAAELVDPVVSASANAGIEKIAAPTPRATASAPTRPTVRFPLAVFNDWRCSTTSLVRAP